MSAPDADRGLWPATQLPDQWAWEVFGRCFADATSRNKLPQKKYLAEGKFAVVDQGEGLVGGFTDDEALVYRGELPVIVWGDHTKIIKFVDFPFVQGADGVKVLRPNDKIIDPRFAYEALKIINLPDKGYSRHFKFLKASRFPVPTIGQQRRIIVKLDSLFKRSKGARKDLVRLPRLIERYKQALLSCAFTGELTRYWRKDRQILWSAEDIRKRLVDERDARRRKEGIRTKGANRNIPPEIRDLPTLPRGWAWMTFEECSWDLTVGHVGPMKSRYVSSGIPFLRSFNVRPNRIDPGELTYIDERFDKELQKSKLLAGTIVVVRTGAPGVAAVIPDELAGANCSDLVICRPIESLHSDYAAYYINSDFAQNLVRQHQVGVAQQHFNIGAMSRLAVPFAPIDEQAEIVRRIQYGFEHIGNIEEEAAHARELLDRLDQAILTKAFRGELVTEA